MSERPKLDTALDGNTFRNYYYLKDELVDFCRNNNLPTSGGKAEITERIAYFLDTGKVLKPASKVKKVVDVGDISEDTFIESGFVCSEKHRAFFKEKIGKSFSFNVLFQRWLKENSGKTYKDAIEAYYKILEKKKRSRTSIDKQFEYNAYIRDFFDDNKGKSMKEAIDCWKYKKSLPGHNRYERSDAMINGFTEKSKEILKDNLVGVYLHGSAVMGCYNPKKSDIDLIVVVKDSISDAVKRLFMDMVVELNGKGPAKGIEMSIVKQSVCKPFVYPTPFELHFSVAHLDWYGKNPDEYISKMKGEDKDLAAHFTIITHRGKCLYGAPIKETFADVPVQDYIDSIWNDIADAEDEITDNPMYLILNLERVLAYMKERLVLSKKEGGEWALENIPEKYASLTKAALSEYVEGEDISYDMALAKDFAGYMVGEIAGIKECSDNTEK